MNKQNQNKKKRKMLQKKRLQSQLLQLSQSRLSSLHLILSLNFMILKQSQLTQRMLQLLCKNFIQLRCGTTKVFHSGYSNMKNSTRKKELRFMFATICSVVSFKELTTKLDHTPQDLSVFMELQVHLNSLVLCYGEEQKSHHR